MNVYYQHACRATEHVIGMQEKTVCVRNKDVIRLQTHSIKRGITNRITEDTHSLLRVDKSCLIEMFSFFSNPNVTESNQVALLLL